MRLKIFPTSFPLLLSSFVLSAALPLSAAVLYPCQSVAHADRTYGTDGTSGSAGADGRDGTSGRAATVDATNQPMNLELQGRDGMHGQPGGAGRRARCRNHTRPDTDVRAADGGDGGKGGNGGDGGNGGNVTVYYQDPNALRNIWVNAAGGAAGRGAQGGIGAQGCNCHEYSWSLTTCPDGNCKTDNYQCRDGDDGDDGDWGNRGKDGESGMVRLIGQSERLKAESPRTVASISQLIDAPITLSRNLWESRSGAQALFAPGSVVRDGYEEYMGRAEQAVQFVWDVRPDQQVSSDVLSGKVAIELNEQGTVEVKSQNDVWIKGDLSTAGPLATYRVNGVVQKEDALRLALGRDGGRSRQFELNVIDQASLSDEVETTFHVRYETKPDERRSRYVTRYDAAIPAELVSREYNLFTLSLGRMPVSLTHLRPGTEAKMEITITRAYGGNEATQVLSWRGRM